MHLLVFDFDGVLRNPQIRRAKRTHETTPYPNIKNDVKLLHATGEYVMVVASFNPDARRSIRQWGLASYFVAYRNGSNEYWDEEGPAPPSPYYNGLELPTAPRGYKPSHYDSQRKSLQIKNMLANELTDYDFDSITFFDDLLYNIDDVSGSSLGYINAILVDEKIGFQTWMLPDDVL